MTLLGVRVGRGVQFCAIWYASVMVAIFRKADLPVATWAAGQIQQARRGVRRKNFVEQVVDVEAALISWHRGDLPLQWFEERLENDLLQKDHNLENTMSRPMHGLAAQQFALALFAVASNMRRIIQFEHDEYELERRAAAGRAPQPRKQPDEYLKRARDRNGETRYMRNPPPRKLVPWEPLELPPVPA